MSKVLNYYYLPTAVDSSVSEVIVNQLSKLKLEEAKVTTSGKLNLDAGKSDKSIRNCLTQGIPSDHWVSGMLAHFVNCANSNLFHFDLHNWADFLHLCVYDKKGSHYDWHTDVFWGETKPFDRKLSITVQLSDPSDYEGGDFEFSEVETPANSKQKGTVLIFPSYLSHRVLPITSGVRRSLVAWFEGPRWN